MRCLDRAFELSSMGIRVDADAMKRQLALARLSERAELPFQKAILNEELPYTIGGGIGQSRLCIVFSAQGAHRRGAGFRMAAGDDRAVRGSSHFFYCKI